MNEKTLTSPANIAFLKARRIETEDARCEALLRDIQKLEFRADVEVPTWDPPAIEELETKLDGARIALSQALGNDEPFDWEEPRVWRELYEHTWHVADKLREIAQNLDDKLREASVATDDERNALSEFQEEARQLELDLAVSL